MILALYNLGLGIYGGLIRLFALWNPKAKALRDGWTADRHKRRTDIVHVIDGKEVAAFELIWIHCASLGEFEMAKPIAAAFINNVNTHNRNRTRFRIVTVMSSCAILSTLT